MTEKGSPNHHPEIVEAGATMTLDELCLSCRVEAGWILELVEHGAIEAIGRSRSDWQFSHVTIVRVAKAKRLERDLALNMPGVALALELLDEIDELRSRLKAAESRR
ncbi:MAG: chaperone modulator CbpM [Alphaproteobacteria bacterium]|nr:chaperone modulator CbpM [Alphaproteobacteria bacterium]